MKSKKKMRWNPEKALINLVILCGIFTITWTAFLLITMPEVFYIV